MPPSPTLTNGIYVQIPAYYIERSEEMIWTLITLNTETGALETQAYTTSTMPVLTSNV